MCKASIVKPYTPLDDNYGDAGELFITLYHCAADHRGEKTMKLKSSVLARVAAVQIAVAVAMLIAKFLVAETDAADLSTGAVVSVLIVVVLSGLVTLGRALTGVGNDLTAVSDELARARARNVGPLSLDPPIAEMRQLVAAVNTVLEQHAQQQTHAVELIDRLRNEAYHDAVTGLANRRAFNLKIDSLMSDGESLASGVLMLARVDGLKDYNQRVGMAAGDRLLASCARAIENLASQVPEAMLARLNGAEFVWLCSAVDVPGARQRAELLATQLRQFITDADAALTVRVGIVSYHERRQVAALWPKADELLRGPAVEPFLSAVDLPRTVDETSLPDADWARRLPNLLERRQIMLMVQPVLTAGKDRVLHREVFSRLRDDSGEAIAAGVFLPQIERLALATRFDQLVVETVLQWLAKKPSSSEQFAVNLSPESVASPIFMEFLIGALRAQPRAATSLIFEVHELALRRTPDAVRACAAALRGVGAGFAIDHFGAGRATLASLSGLALDYVKIDAGYVRGVLFNDEHRSSVKLMVDLARQGGARAIAESVETREEFDTLVTLGVDGLRGYFCGGLAPLQVAA